MTGNVHICDKKIGPTFAAEIAAAEGLIGQHFCWFTPNDPNGEYWIEFFDDTPQEVIDGVLAVFAAHDPTKA